MGPYPSSALGGLGLGLGLGLTENMHERSEHVTVLAGCVAYVPPSTTDHALTSGQGEGGTWVVGICYHRVLVLKMLLLVLLVRA